MGLSIHPGLAKEAQASAPLALQLEAWSSDVLMRSPSKKCVWIKSLIYVHAYIYVYIHILHNMQPIYPRIHNTHVHKVHMYICISIYISVHMYVYMYIYVYTIWLIGVLNRWYGHFSGIIAPQPLKGPPPPICRE